MAEDGHSDVMGLLKRAKSLEVEAMDALCGVIEVRR
jgi:hypothetical protein